MNYTWIIEIECFCIIILFIILYNLLKNYDRQIKQRYYIRAVIFGIFSSLTDINWALIESHIIYEPPFINFLTNAAYYIVTVLMGYYWLLYVETSLETQWITNKKIKLITVIPVLYVIIGVIISYFKPFFFYIDANNTYNRGKFIISHTLCCHIYTFITSIHSFIKSLKCKDYLKAAEYRVLSMFLIFPFSIGIIQILFPKIPTVSIGITLSFLYVYIDLQNLLISVDTLSGLNNKNQLMRFLTGRLKSISKETSLYILMMDINNFKKINDTYGHIEGDEALRRCSLAIKLANHNSKNFIARFGGDEFIIISETKDEKEIQNLCLKIKQNLNDICQKEKINYELTISIGYAKYETSMKSIQELIKAADKNLYEVKKAVNNIRKD